MEIQRIGNQQPRFTGAFKLSVKNDLLEAGKHSQRVKNLTDLLDIYEIPMISYNSKCESLPFNIKAFMTEIGNKNASKIINAAPEREGFTTTTIIAGNKDLASFAVESLRQEGFMYAAKTLLSKLFKNKMTEGELSGLNKSITKIESGSTKAINDMNLKRFEINSESEIPSTLIKLKAAINKEENNPAQAINFEI